MYHSVVVTSLLVATILVAIGEGSYCPTHQCSTQLLLYQEYCCNNASNLGNIVMVADNARHFFLRCPATLSASCPFSSCGNILTANPTATSGYYDIVLADGSVASVYCNMEGCDGEGGWTRVAYLDMSDPSQQCPSDFRLYDENGVRACGRQTSSIGSCSSVTYSTNGISYSQVCGRVVGYQYASPDAIDSSLGTGPINHNNIDAEYVDGVSITRGSPRQHIWTLMAFVKESYNLSSNGCPCNSGSTVSVQSFIEDDYFCESANPLSDWMRVLYSDDPLWDGEGCGGVEGACCAVPGIPWFHKVLPSPTTDYIELRVCGDQSTYDENVPVRAYEIYVK